MEAITKKDVLEMTATIVAGILSNPAAGNLLSDQYSQQQLIQTTFQNVTDAFFSIGVLLAESEK